MKDGKGLEVGVETRGGATIIKPIGDIDLSRSPRLRTELLQVQSKKPSKLIIDLSEVPYMDSSGVATLVEAMKEARKSGSGLTLCALQDRVRSIFEIARLDVVFRIVDSCDEALQD